MWIDLKGVEKRVPGPGGNEVAILRDIDLSIDQGEYVCIRGRSGSGKSTLLHVLGGIDPASRGTVHVAGENLTGCGEAALGRFRARKVGIVFQFFQLMPSLSALENVLLAMELAAVVPVGERRKRAAELLEKLGVGALANRVPALMSGGEQQRVAIARALANRPRLLLADEPTGNLDSQTASDVQAIFASIAREGVTVVVVTHEAGVEERYQRVIRLSDGRITADIRRGELREVTA